MRRTKPGHNMIIYVLIPTCTTRHAKTKSATFFGWPLRPIGSILAVDFTMANSKLPKLSIAFEADKHLVSNQTG